MTTETRTEPVAETVPDHTDPNRRATRAEIMAARAWVDAFAADWNTTEDDKRAADEEYQHALAILVHARKLIDEETTTNLIGDEDETPGVLDRYFVLQANGIVAWHCRRECGDEGNGTAHIIARNFDGDQTNLTLGEMAHSALEHEAEEHGEVTQ